MRWLVEACRSRSQTFLLLCVLVAACMPASNLPPVVAPSGVVGPRASGVEAARALAVVFVGPQGKAGLNSVPQVVFNQPLRALGAASEAPALGITIEPPAAGAWQWVGARALRFYPELGRLAAATRYRVTIPAGVRSLDGLVLAAAKTFEFETPRPEVLRAFPPQDLTDVELDTPITLGFNQRLELGEIQRRLTLSARVADQARTLAFQVRPARDRAGTGEPLRVDVVPQGGLPAHARIELSLAEGLVAAEGPLASDKPYTLSFETYGALRVTELGCVAQALNGCDPRAGVRIELSTPVRVGALKRAFKVTPPAPLAFPSWSGDEDTVRSVDLEGSLMPRSRYEVSIGAELTDTYGQVLAQKESRTLVVGDFEPRVRLGVRGEVLPAPSPTFVLGALNVPNLELFSKRLSGPELASYLSARDEKNAFAALAALPGAQRSALSGDISNLSVQRSLSPELLLGGSARGALALGWRYQDSRGEPVEDGRLVQVTDLALTGKLSRQGSWVWVTSLSQSLPVAGATLRVLGSEPPLALEYRTNEQGAVFIPPQDFTPPLHAYDTRTDALLVAEYRGDTSFRRVRDFIPTWRVDPNVDFDAGRREYGLLFAERGLYRPGESLKLKGVIRREQGEGNAVVAERALSVVLQDPNGEDVEELPVRTNAFGSFATELHVPQTAGLGQFRVLTKGLEGSEASTFFDVAEFRPAEFKVEAAAAAPSYLRGAKARFSAQADYLYGAPMAGAALAYRVARMRTSFAPEHSEGFSTSDEVYWQDREQASIGSAILSNGSVELDTHGQFSVEVPLALPGQIGPESVRIDADVTDVSRQQLSGSAATLVHPASFYVGIAELEDWFQSVPGALEPRVVALTPDGQRVAGRRVVVELLRRRWVMSRVEANGSYETVSKVLDEPRGQCAAVTALEPVKCSIDLRESGYYILLASAQDEKGRKTRAALPFYALGKGSPSFKDDDQRKLELVVSKPQYRVGETARVLIKSPFQRARALLTLERAGVHESRWLTLEGPTPFIDVPIKPDMRPNVYVSVLVLPPGPKAAGPDQPEAAYRLGYTNLVVDPEERRLQLAIQTRTAGASGASGALATSYAPGDTVDATFAVRDAQGRPAAAELTVYAVDEGVLSLSGYQVPDPIKVFTEPRPLSVATLETRDALAKVFLPELGKGSGGDKGDAGGGGGDEARSDFKTSAYFNPSVVTDARGLARVQFPLPDNLTTFRLMAVAVGRDDRYGFASTQFSVSKALMARPALPRFLRAGDTLEASVVVSRRDGKPGRVQVDAGFDGVTLLGPAQQSLDLGANGVGEARFALRAERVTTASFGFAVLSGSERDSVRIRREIQSPARLETTAVYGQTEKPEAQALGDLSQLRPDVGGLELNLASTALVGLDTALETLSDYPYLCTEQLSSRLLPLGPLRELAAAYGKPPPGAPAALMESTVGEILKRQSGDGGFRLWPSSPDSQPWLSAYALWTLGEARKAGVRIPERVFESGRSYLRDYLSSAREQPDFFATAPLVLDVLGVQGEPDLGALSFVFERRPELPLFGKAFLLHAAIASKAGPALSETLRRELEARVDLRGNQASLQRDEKELYPALFDSGTRTHALVLWALIAAEPRHVLGAPLAQGLLTARRERGWQSTQESAYALLALDAYRRAQEPAPPSFAVAVWFGKERLLDHEFAAKAAPSRFESLPMARLRVGGEAAAGAGPQALIFDKHGDGTLFYEARLRYAPLAPPTDELERGFFVQKTLRAVAREKLSEALKQVPEVGQERFAASDLVLTDLVVIAPSDRHYVVLDDPLPAGFEAVDTQLRTTGADLDISGSYADDADPKADSGFQYSWYRQELRDDRALFFIDHMPAGIYHYRYLARATALGRFVVPPTRAEEMYQPEVFGRTAARVVEVTAPGSRLQAPGSRP
jgi:alpha-2-macroglobulin